MAAHNVLITGGAGFIGSQLARALVSAGAKVTVLDDLSMGRAAHVPAGAELIRGDVRDANVVLAAMRGADVVYHLAARVSIRDSLANFAADAETNVLGTIRVLQACAGARPRRLVLASSMAVYADCATATPLQESYATAPISPYGLGKLTAERYVLQIGAGIGVEPVVLRFFNTYGPGQSESAYVGVIRMFIRKLLRGEPPAIFGTGEQRRDFVHVEDVVRACLLAGDAPDAVGQAINVGTGRATSVNEIAALLIARISPDVSPLRAAAQAGELQNSIADISLARRVLGYEPQRQLQESIGELIDALRCELPQK